MRNILLILSITVSFSGFAQRVNSESIYDLRIIDKQYYLSNNTFVKEHPHGLEINVEEGEDGMITFLPKNKYWDLTQWVFLSLELENHTTKEVRFEPEILYDNPKRGKKTKKVKNKHIGFLQPKESLIYNCVLIRDKINISDYPQESDFPVMKGLPNGVILNFDGIDAKHIKGFKIVFPKQDFDRKIVLKHLFKNRQGLPDLYKSNKGVFFPFINEYGQYKHGTWEGKITNDNQFTAAFKKEKGDLEKHPGSMEWNRFGGFANGPKFEATGHFRTQKINGKWWIIDPSGSLFWSTGINGAGKLEVATPYNKREHFFENLPKKNSEHKKFFSKNSYLYGLQNLYKKYGENAEEKYIPITLNRMKSWGLNTLGGWSVETVARQPENKKLPYTVITSSISPGINDKFPDVFDPKWKEITAKKIKEKAALVKDDPYFFGFFINNEIHWGTPFSLANNTLAKGPKTSGKQVYIKLLQKDLKTIANFNIKTGGDFKSWEELLNTKVSEHTLKLHTIKEINTKHYELMVEQYFQITKGLINDYAPGKMYIGCRWHGNHKNKINVTIAAKYLDILSFNAYENEIEKYPYPPKELDKPFIVSEFNFGALDVGKFFTGLGYASNQRNRGEKYINFIEGALRNPKCVGAHWFMWANSTTAGRGNGENANCGLVSMTDQIYYELISYMRKINYNIYKKR
ncbi:hypothetical protein [Algibacter mikhailovii]|uniref:Glycoside hydrolase family 42 N-terminal domain-containing protein n=1 Tax=Algibacter mikhailovii TaxID=425498 RepID=A0A918VCU5_9FLAO|nr:hypothetical protein [Algibacter mikhailovii]GGZ87421.1 hypothetical protein GCM10007028_27010 [Algibacter mikhailovii]